MTHSKKSFLFAVSLLFAIVFFFSCSSDSDGDGSTPSSSSSSGNSSSACVNPSSYGSFNTVLIGEQTWMAENLNYAACGSKCYDNDPANCEIYGRLYDWETANTACPSGWHLPSYDEWNVLYNFVSDGNMESKYLKATSGWDNENNGLNTYGFAALPGGRGYPGDSSYEAGFRDVGYGGYWWTSEDGSSSANLMSMDNFMDDYLEERFDDYHRTGAHWSSQNKALLNSVRCVQD